MKLLVYVILLAHLFSVSHMPYVPSVEDRLMQWHTAERYGAMALVAHDYLAGSYFYELHEGDIILLVYDGGVSERWTVTDIYLMDNQSMWSDTYFKYYKYGNLVLQTCYDLDGNLLVIAQKEK